jgi:hypothetical protein
VAARPGGSSAMPVPRGAAKLEPNKWYGLLGEPPTERFWPRAPAVLLKHDAEREMLTAQTPHTGLVRLGTGTGTYRLQIGAVQMGLPGGFGVYFGGHAVGTHFEFQYLIFKKVGLGPGREYALERGRGRVVPDGAVPGVAVHGLATDFLRPLMPGEQLLELTVLPEGLTDVRWAGGPCAKVTGERATAATSALPLAGEYGILCNGATVTVTTARVLVSE